MSQPRIHNLNALPPARCFCASSVYPPTHTHWNCLEHACAYTHIPIHIYNIHICTSTNHTSAHTRTHTHTGTHTHACAHMHAHTLTGRRPCGYRSSDACPHAGRVVPGLRHTDTKRPNRPASACRSVVGSGVGVNMHVCLCVCVCVCACVGGWI